MQNTSRIQKYMICAFVLFFTIETNAQDSTVVKRRLNIEFSFYGYGSKNTVNTTEGSNLAKSFIDFNTGNAIRFSYDFNQRHAVVAGFNYYRKNISFDYTIEKEEYNLPFSIIDDIMEYTAHIVGLSVSYQYSVPLSTKTKLIIQPGYIISFPIIGYVDSGVSYIEHGQQKTILSVMYNNPKKSNNLFFEFGFCRALKINELKFSLLCQIPLKKLFFANYTFFNNIQENISEGVVKSGLGYIGLNVSYILTHKKRD